MLPLKQAHNTLRMPPYSQDSALAQQQPLAAAPKSMPPSTRDVATGVVNLGNTCYMNAVLQALAHCQELNMAMDMEPHSATCPIAKSRPKSASPSPENNASRGTRKSARSNGKKSPSPDGNEANDSSFCALCEFEHHLHQVHSTSEPVAPSAFVNGFIDHVAPWFKLGVQEDSHEFLRLLIDAMQKSCTKARSSSSSKQQEEDMEYPFQLFRGTVESNVQCESCQAESSTIDPIEDIGLDVSATKTTAYGQVTPPPNALADVPSAFTRFKAEENLEGYKCEKCGKTGKATKQSRLASIPPILTLHLKRFRYGTSTEEVAARRRSEISQLLARDASTTGKSGSAKIEGHVKFSEFFDLRPFLTKSLEQEHKTMFCRLFAVIVHAGANSHSGHYIAYVRNLEKSEWWKMDDARVSRVPKDEVMDAEAYMLFYRVVEHPTLTGIQQRYKEFVDTNKEQVKAEQQPDTATSHTEPTAESKTSDKKRKREMPEFLNGEDWATNKTQLAPHLMSFLRRGEEFVADNAEFDPKYFSLIEEAAKKERGAPGSLGGTSILQSLQKMLLSRRTGALIISAIFSHIASFRRG